MLHVADRFFYLSQHDKRDFNMWQLDAVLPSGERFPVNGVEDIKYIRALHPSWDGHVVAQEKGNPSSIYHMAVDQNSIEGKPPLDARPALLVQIGANSTHLLDNPKTAAATIAETMFCPPRQSAKPSMEIVEAVRRLLESVPNSANVVEVLAFTSAASSLLTDEQLADLVTYCAQPTKIVWKSPSLSMLHEGLTTLQNTSPARRLVQLKEVWDAAHTQDWWMQEDNPDPPCPWCTDESRVQQTKLYETLLPLLVSTDGHTPLKVWDQWIQQWPQSQHLSAQAHLLPPGQYTEWCENQTFTNELDFLTLNLLGMTQDQIEKLTAHISSISPYTPTHNFALFALHPQMDELPNTPSNAKFQWTVLDLAFTEFLTTHCPLPAAMVEKLVAKAKQHNLVFRSLNVMTAYPQILQRELSNLNSRQLQYSLVAAPVENLDFLYHLDLAGLLSRIKRKDLKNLASEAQHPALLNYLVKHPDAEIRAKACSNVYYDVSEKDAVDIVTCFADDQHNDETAVAFALHFLSKTNKLALLPSRIVNYLADWCDPTSFENDFDPSRLYAAAYLAAFTKDEKAINAVFDAAAQNNREDALLPLISLINEDKVAKLFAGADLPTRTTIAEDPDLPTHLRPLSPVLSLLTRSQA